MIKETTMVNLQTYIAETFDEIKRVLPELCKDALNEGWERDVEPYAISVNLERHFAEIENWCATPDTHDRGQSELIAKQRVGALFMSSYMCDVIHAVRLWCDHKGLSDLTLDELTRRTDEMSFISVDAAVHEYVAVSMLRLERIAQDYLQHGLEGVKDVYFYVD